MIFRRPFLTITRPGREWWFSYCVTSHSIDVAKYVEDGVTLWVDDARVTEGMRYHDIPVPDDVKKEVFERFCSALRVLPGFPAGEGAAS